MGLKKHEIEVSEENIQKILNKLDETISNIERLDGEESFLNPIYGISCKSGDNYVLKVINPLEKWKKVKTLNEVKAIELIKKANIPVPKIYDYSTSKDLIGFEYILMEKFEGNNLKDVFEKRKLEYLSQIADIIQKFQQFSYRKIGSFTENNSIGPDLDIGNGPFNSFKDWIIAAIKSRLNHMEKTRFAKYIPKFKNFCELIEDKDMAIFFCHGDLAPKNMIEKDGKIIGLFDFEWAGAFPYVYDAANYNHDFNLNGAETKYFYKLLDERNIVYNIPEKIKDIKHIENLSMIFVSYQDWFIGREKEGEKDVAKHERDIIALFKKYDI